MEAYYLLLLIIIAFLFFFLLTPSKKPALPPGPPSIPILGNLLWLRRFPSHFNIETLVRDLRPHLGPIITLRIGTRTSIFITDRHLVHKALIELGAVFSSRPPQPLFSTFPNTRITNISSAPYGNTWRLLRRNLTSHILHPAKFHLFAHGRRWVLGLLLREIHTESRESPRRAVVPKKNFRFAMFGLLALMCFGERLDEKSIREIEDAHRELLLHATKNWALFTFFPKCISGFLFGERFRTMRRLRRRQSELFFPLITACRENRKQGKEEQRVHCSYVDSLLDITIAEEGGRQLTDDEVAMLCGEFLIAGTDTTASALEWTMAEIAASPAVQAKLAEEVDGRSGGEEIKDEELLKMSYLKAVVLEGLRRHPPAHFVLPHSVTEDTIFEGYLIPKNVPVNFVASEVGWDERVWEEAMDFVPERFMAGGEGEGADITGSREIKMMPFGVGRRICPGFGLAMLHLHYFVANLVREFKWEAMDGEEIDFSEKSLFIVAMKKPLRALVTPRTVLKSRADTHGPAVG
ncbi:Cytochrome P450 89A9 [Platanthera zijinensis]|uniref:Cytochrome P450 89A9 n=1 Tax=Platanthera zijinensis TaxID=2320716 RepID=A0AAP0BA96_9ASPA